MSAVVAHKSSVPMENERCLVIVNDLCKTSNGRFSLVLLPSTTCSILYAEVSKKVHYVVGTFDLVLASNERMSTNSDTVIDENEELNLRNSKFSLINKNYVSIRERPGVAVEMLHPSTIQEDDEDSCIPEPPPLLPSNQMAARSATQRRMAVSSGGDENISTPNRSNSPIECTSEMATLKMLKMVGLVNQAMTCYLNSLIQTLYMTPEFRNALYKWKCDVPSDKSTSIPYQLQHLFLSLQTSDKQSIETTGLTRSFGWDSSEAWQQHDIQELCRVMFDALEKKFEGTDQADLIKQLYEGKMKDYVQCCECGHESARDDTFLDVPITIRPFGSTKSYKSVLEGLNAFVEPETLDESNQYYCEKCDKKCDAKKGLKFIKFPYLLTLQLKRFDFDYSTMHRIKLNDRMNFPQILNLNTFIDETKLSDTTEVDSVNDEAEESTTSNSEPGDEETSSHDSGNDFDRTSMIANNGSGDGYLGNQRNSSEDEGSSVDEGIDIDSQISTRKKRKSNSSWWMNDEAEEIDSYMKEGPYVYELFSIMVHSGSAAGGHYYAYIKSFENNHWYSFNDQIVSPIDHTDVEKTFGGSPYARTSSYYSSFSSSTNAYMLMYRQINPSKNTDFIKTCDLPHHLVELLKHEENAEKKRKLKLEDDKNKCSIRLFCRHPSLLKHVVRIIVEESFEFHKDTMLTDAVVQAHLLMKLDKDIVPPERCRLVKYDHINDAIDRSFDVDTDDANSTLSYLLDGVKTTYLFDLLLETRKADEEFERYESGGVTIKVFLADHQNVCFQNPIFMRATESQTVLHLKTTISERIGCPVEKLLVAYEKYRGECRLLQSNKRTLKSEGFYKSAKVYVDVMADDEYNASTSGGINCGIRLDNTFLWTILDRMANVISVNINLPPETNSECEKDEVRCDETSENHEKSNTVNSSSSSSSDEGVGSLGGSSGNGGAQGRGDVDVNLHQTTWNENEEDSKRESDLTTSEINCFWRIPELTGSDYEAPTPTDDDEYKGTRRRNNSYDNDATLSTISADFPGKLQERLEGYAMRMSPTSSLKCEDGNSSHSGQNSLITDMDFEGDASNDGILLEDGSTRALPVGSEGSSLSTSCSTLDSTDTLCNTTDPNSSNIDANLVSSVNHAQVDISSHYGSFYSRSEIIPSDIMKKSVEVSQCEVVMASDGSQFEQQKTAHTISYTERTDPCSSKTANEQVSEYNKALRYVDGGASKMSQNLSLLDDERVSGAGDPSDTNSMFNKSKSTIITSEPCKNVAWDDNVTITGQHDVDNAKLNTDNAMVNFCTSPKLCTDCGVATSQCSNLSTENLYDSADPESFQFSESNSVGQASDPDSGEGMDKLQPLISETSHSGDGSSKHYKSNAGPEVSNMSNHFRRERTVSSSSMSSDTCDIQSDQAQKHSYFRVVSTTQTFNTSMYSAENEDVQSSKVICVEIDKRMTLLGLKRHLAHIICTPSRRFCVYKQYSGGQEVELFTPTDDFRLVTDGTNFIVRLGRALRRDEFRCKLYQLALDEEETSKPFMNWIVQRGMSIEDARKELSNDIAEQCDIICDPARIRLRKKTWRSPGQVFLVDDVFGTDISLYGSLEFFVEFLDQPEPKNKRTDLVLLCRRWSPSLLQFSDFHEVILNNAEHCSSYLGYTAQHLRSKLAEISGIPVEHIQMAKGRGMFPYRISVLCANAELEWVPTYTQSHTYSIHLSDDGTVIFYKDNREGLKECNDEERAEIEREEMKSDSTIGTCSRVSSSLSTSSPSSRPTYRREKALKIYTVDTSPVNKTNETTTEL